MSQIVWEEFLEKGGLLLSIQITEDGLNSFIFSEQTPLPPGVAGMEPRHFKSKEDAVKYAEQNYIPGRRTQGWRLKELG
jgi:hypothetical protein